VYSRAIGRHWRGSGQFPDAVFLGNRKPVRTAALQVGNAGGIEIPHGAVNKNEMTALQVFHGPGGEVRHRLSIVYPPGTGDAFIGTGAADGDGVTLGLAGGRLKNDFDFLCWLVKTIGARLATEVREAICSQLG